LNRKNRLRKGIESIEKQIEIHKKKKKEAEKESKLELAEYYGKELKKLIKYKEKKEKLLKNN
tara:strand:- start:1 stop:186 length:186 start_codon:yes stop_codon:yes gene_type:complete